MRPTASYCHCPGSRPRTLRPRPSACSPTPGAFIFTSAWARILNSRGGCGHERLYHRSRDRQALVHRHGRQCHFRGKSIAIDPQGRFFFDGWGITLGTIDSALISPADGTALTGISSVTSPNQIPVAMLADSSGKFLYVQQGPAAVVYAVNQATGALTVSPATLTVFSFSAGTAAADPLGPYIYSLQQDGVHGFLVDPQSGALSEVPGSPFGSTVAQGALAISGAPVQAVSGPVAALFPASEDFGAITVGQSSNSKLVTLTNTGGRRSASPPSAS